MTFFDFQDPVFLLILVGALALIAVQFSLRKKHEDETHRTAIKKQRLDGAVHEKDRVLIDTGWTVEGKRTVTLTQTTTDIDVDAQVRLARELSDIHLREIQGEDDAAIRAAKERDKYERQKERQSGRVQAQRPGDSVPQAAGNQPGSSKSTAGRTGSDSKAADRHRKPESPDPNSRA